MRAGPHNALTDVTGLRVGHARVAGALSGVTVILAPPGGAVAGVDVRGAAPGTRETDLLDPGATVPRVHALLLSGGSAFGLAAADGVMARLAGAGVGFPVPGAVVPIVPAAVLFDLGRGGAAGDPALRPTAAVGATAVDAAVGGPVAQGVVGAGVGALVGGLKGGIGTASLVLDLEPAAGEVQDAGAGRGATQDPRPDAGVGQDAGVGPRPGAGGFQDGGAGQGADRGEGRAGGRGATATVAALVAVNAAGSAVDPATGGLLGARLGLPGEFALPAVGAAARAALHATAASVRPRLGTATTLAVVATDVALDKAGCARLATMGHDGLARALAPAHTATDGDTVFGLATGAHPALDLPGLVALQAAAADVVSRAVVHAVLAAETVTTPVGTWRSYRDVVANPG